MFQFRNTSVIGTFAIAFAAVLSGNAKAEETVCRGTIGAVTLDRARVRWFPDGSLPKRGGSSFNLSLPKGDYLPPSKQACHPLSIKVD